MNKARIFTLVFAILMVSSLLLSACAPAATPTAAPTQPPAAQPTTPPAAANTAAPSPAPTAIPMVCAKLPDAPTAAAGELGSPDKPIVITFVPSGDTGKITKAGTAIADCLSQMTGLNFKIEVGTTFAASIEAMGAEKAQVGFLNTFSVLLAEAKYGIIPALATLRKYNTNAIDPDKGLAASWSRSTRASSSPTMPRASSPSPT